MKNSLVTIQKLAKAGKILSKIVEVCCIVGFCGCIVGIVALAVLKGSTYTFKGVTIHGIIEASAEMTVASMYTTMAVGLVFCAAESILAGMSVRFFKHELEIGTPFNFEVADKMKKLGIWAIIMPIAAAVVAGLVYTAMDLFFDVNVELKLENLSGIGIGIAFLVTSVICRYGAECMEKEVDVLN